MKQHFQNLTPEQQSVYGNGCGVRGFNVPDFVFTASCRHHDFNFERGSGTWWKAPYYYTKANWDFFALMWSDCYLWYHYIIAVIYFVVVMLVSWPWFTVGRWRTMEEILARDKAEKLKATNN